MALIVAVMGLRRRSIPGATAFSLMMWAVFVWALTSGLCSAATGVDAKLFFAMAGYAGSTNVAPLFLLFALRYRKHAWKPEWWQLAILWLVPAATFALAITYRWHGLMWTDFTVHTVLGSNIIIFTHGPWFFASVAYYALLGVLAALILGRAAWRAQRMFVRQTVTLLAGLLVPWIFSAIYILPVSPFPGLDLPPIGFAITGLLVMRGMRRFQLLDVVPVARHFLVESMEDGVLVLDARDRVVDVNPTARALIGSAAEVVGRPLDDVPGPLGAAIAGLRERGADHIEVSLPGTPGRYVDIHLSRLVDRVPAEPAHDEARLCEARHHLGDRRGGRSTSPPSQGLKVVPTMGGQIPKIDDAPWPGFPADIISIALVVATQAEGTVLIHEKMFESRMFYVDKLIGMGARIILCDPHRAVVTGPSRLTGSELVSPDVRAGMAMLIAAMCAQGRSCIQNVYQIERGYENLTQRLQSLGARISRNGECAP